MNVNPAPGLVLSVITVAAYDIARLRITLDSFLGACSKVEFVVVCPREDKETISFLKFFTAQSQLQISVHHDDGVGVYEAMNRGSISSNGEYLIFWNAGDTCTSTDVLSQFIDDISITSPTWGIAQGMFEWREQQKLNTQNLKNFVLQLGGYISHQTVFVRKLEFMTFGGFDSSYKVAADTKMITQFWKKYDVNFYNLEVVKVEFPNFSAENNRVGRLENLKLCLLELPWKFKALSLSVALSRELHYAFTRIRNILSQFEGS